MNSERYVIRPSTQQPVIGSTFTLTLTPSTVIEKNSTDARDENANLADSKREETERKTRKSTEKRQSSDSQFDEKFLALFKSVAGKDGEVDAFELQNVMGLIFKRDFGSVKDFNLESCRSMVVMSDADRSGKLTYGQFKALFEWIMELRNIFKQYESSQSWDMDANDLKEALRNLDYKISQTTIDMVAVRYYNRRKRINFDDFLQICCRLKACANSYDSYQTVGDSFDDFLMHIVYT